MSIVESLAQLRRTCNEGNVNANGAESLPDVVLLFATPQACELFKTQILSELHVFEAAEMYREIARGKVRIMGMNVAIGTVR
jgi:hypothetical protein